jgi:hypothetical protein
MADPEFVAKDALAALEERVLKIEARLGLNAVPGTFRRHVVNRRGSHNLAVRLPLPTSKAVVARKLMPDELMTTWLARLVKLRLENPTPVPPNPDMGYRRPRRIGGLGENVRVVAHVPVATQLAVQDRAKAEGAVSMSEWVGWVVYEELGRA